MVKHKMKWGMVLEKGTKMTQKLPPGTSRDRPGGTLFRSLKCPKRYNRMRFWRSKKGPFWTLKCPLQAKIKWGMVLLLGPPNVLHKMDPSTYRENNAIFLIQSSKRDPPWTVPRKTPPQGS